jgi:hypothetical protein
MERFASNSSTLKIKNISKHLYLPTRLCNIALEMQFRMVLYCIVLPVRYELNLYMLSYEV